MFTYYLYTKNDFEKKSHRTLREQWSNADDAVLGQCNAVLQITSS